MSEPMKPQPMDLFEIKEKVRAQVMRRGGCLVTKTEYQLNYARGWNAALKAMEAFEAQCLANEKD